jgi:LysM repeat protein
MSLSPQKALAALALVALPALTAPVTAAAPDSAATTRVQARTHTVRRGDTLWDLSRSYLSDPFLWPEIYRLNTKVVEDPHWIYPGERLVLPDAVAVAAEPEAEPEEESAEALFANATRTRSPVAPGRLEPLGHGHYAAVRPGEVYPAPFVDRDGGPVGSGRILQNVALTNIRSRLDEQALLLNDEVYVTAPKGQAPAAGDRYLVYTLGTRLEKLGQLIVPTGILRIESAQSGSAPRARLTRQFGRVLAGQYLLPLDAETAAPGERPSAVEAPPSATVVWIPDEPVLPSLQQYVVLDASARAGVRVGDQFTLVRPREAQQPGALPLPEEEIAVAQVVRVTPYAATAIVVSQKHPAIRRGTRARVSAKMP